MMHHYLKRSFLFFFALVTSVFGVSAQNAELAEGYYRIISQRTSLPVSANNRTLGYISEHSNTDDNGGTDLSIIWKVKRTGNTYWIVNAKEKLAIQPQDRLNVSFTTGVFPAAYYIKRAVNPKSKNKDNPDIPDAWIISTTEDFQGNTLWHNGGSGLVQNWNGTENTNNYWRFEPVSNEVKASLAALDNEWPQLEKNFKQMLTIRQGGLFRVMGQQKRYWTENAQTREITTTDQVDKSQLNTVWIVASNGDDGITLRNAATGHFVAAPDNKGKVTASTSNAKIFLNFLQSSANFYQLGTNADFTAGSCFVETAQHIIAGGNGVQNNAPNTAADWQLVPVSDVSEAQVRQAIQQNSHGVYTPEVGKYYVVRNVNYPSRVLVTTRSTDNHLEAQERDEREMAQLWELTKVQDQWALRNVVNQRYVSNSAARSQNFTLVDQPAPFSIQLQDKWLPYIAFVGANSSSLHCASSQDYHVVNWDASSPASQWQLEAVNIDAAALEAYKNAFAEYDQLTSQREKFTTTLQKFFDDFACTQLKTSYRNMSDKDLTAALSAEKLPQTLIDMALRVKNNTWNTQNADANHYEKRFRIAEYQAYSHPQLWARDLKLMPTSFGQYSQITNPTGITIDSKTFVNVFVDQDAPANCELKAELVQGKNKTGELSTLRKGLNTLYVPATSHLYINYVINDVNLKYTDQPKIRIHIEGGRANGYHDLQQDSNADWDKLRQLKAYGFLNDEVVRLKSKHTIHSLSLKGVEEQQDKGNWMYNGEYKGINGVLGKWDWINEMEQDFFSPERFTGRFNCLLFNTDAIGLYASNYGTFLGTVSTTFSYDEYANGGGPGNLWAVAHETGHHYQKLFNLARCMESSNNTWSNIALWKRGSTVSRGDALQQLINRYNSGQSWFDMTISDRMRMYWQLWLYYEELGHHPGFFRQLFDKFRENPIDMSNAKTDYLRFAQFCSEVAQEDLTEFFTFYGFFRKVGNDLPMKYNDGFYDSHYAPAKISVSQADIDACKAAMAVFPKKATNLMFIDERIRPVPATYEGVKPGTMRRGTSGEPGDASIFGDVGHYTDFGVMNADGSVKEAPTVAKPEAVQLDGRTVRIKGTGAVGYKVLDENGNVVAISNRNLFALPANVDVTKLTVVVGGGDGKTVTVIEKGKVLEQYQHDIAVPDNTSNLLVVSSSHSTKGKYLIRNYEKINGKYYYANALTQPTNDLSKAGEFLIVSGNHSGELHIFSVAQQKWASYNNTNSGANRIVWVDDLGASRAWNIQHYYNGKESYYNVRPAGNNTQGWNWHGGVGNANNGFGFYQQDDKNSHWMFVPADLATQYHALWLHADSIARKDSATVHNSQRAFAAFRSYIDGNKLPAAPTQDNIDALRAEIQLWQAWYTADSLLQRPTYDHPEYTQFRTPFKALLDKDDFKSNTAKTLQEYSQYFQLLLNADSLLSQKNPGFALPAVAKASVEKSFLLRAAAAQTPDMSPRTIGQLGAVLTGVIDESANPRRYKTDSDAYYMPEDGKVYRLRSFYDQRFISARPTKNVDNKPVDISQTKAADETSLWVTQKAPNGKYYLAAANGKGYIGLDPNIYSAMLFDQPKDLLIGTGRRQGNQHKYGTLALRNADASFLLDTRASNVAADGLNTTDNAPAFQRNAGNRLVAGTSIFFDEVADASFSVTTHAGSNGNYATLQLPYATILPEGLTAYQVKEVENANSAAYDRQLVLTPLEGTVLPANTPVVLSSPQAGTFALRPTQWQAPKTSLLKGTNLPLAAKDRDQAKFKYFALTFDATTNEALFRLINPTLDITIPGNRAYFTLPASSGAAVRLSFRILPQPTSVKTVTKSSTSGTSYDLSGRPVDANTTQGIIIENGHKVIRH